MRNYLLSLVFIAIILQTGLSQEPSEALKSTFRDGEFFLAREDYVDALVEFQQVYKRGFDNANVNYRIGVCYLNIPGQKTKAIPHLEKAVKNVTRDYTEGVLRETKAAIDAYLYLGNAYRINNQLDDAITAYNQFKKLIPEEKEEIYLQFTEQQIKACKLAKKAISEPVVLDKNNMGETINSSSSNYKAVMSGDGNTLAYMYELPFYDAVYYSVKENDEWGKPKNITPEIQSDGDQFVAALSHDGKQLILTREDVFNSDVYVSNIQEDGTWSKSEPISRNVNSKYWESHASMSPDGNTLYFSSNRNDSRGGMDIYRATKDDNNNWNKPENIGGGINTPLNEEYPFVTNNGQQLYFSSQGHNSIGGYDIFYSEKDEQGNWQKPVNIGYPVNTTDDDLFYFPIGNGDCGLMTLIEQDGYGKEDVYKVCKIPQERIEEAIAERVEIDREEEIERQEAHDTASLIEDEEEVREEVEKTDTQIVKEDKPEKEPDIEEFTVKPIHFAFDDYRLAEEAKQELDRIAELMNRKEKLHVKLFGYTDSIGTDTYNMLLSKNRANAAKTYLVKQDVDADRIVTYAQGEANPVAPNTKPDGSDNDQGRRKNRRVEFEFAATQAAHVKIIQQ